MKTKHILIGLAVVGAGVGIYFLMKPKSKNDNSKSDGEKKSDASRKINLKGNTEFYSVRLPFVTDISTKFSNYLDTQSIPYKVISVNQVMDENAKQVLDYNLEISEGDFYKLKSSIDNLNKGFVIKKITKEQAQPKPIEKIVCVVKRNEINSFKEYNESIGCTDYSVLFGYDLTSIGKIKNIENKISLNELRELYNKATMKDKDNSESRRNYLTNILKKAFA